jgi:hypothetical protein
MAGILPPRSTRAPSPRLVTVHEVEEILRRAAADDEGPLRLAEIKRRMRAKSVRHATVRACVEEMKRLHLVTEDPTRGVMWTLHEDPRFWSRRGLRKL